MLQLKLPSRNPYPGQTKSVDAGTLRLRQPAPLRAAGRVPGRLIGAPVSYARAIYHAVHTFWVTAPDGIRRPVRFSWQPVAGVRNIKHRPTEPCDKYLFDGTQRPADGGGRPGSC